MNELNKKIKLLKEIAQRFNTAYITWSLGASMLLYFKGITSTFNDIDLMISNDDAESVEKLKDVIKRINPDKIGIVRIDDERMRKTMWVDDERFEEIKKELLNVK